MTVLALVYVDAYRGVRQARMHVNLLNVVSQIQLNIRNTVNDPGSWGTTYNANGSMDCVKNRSCLTAVPPTTFVLWPAGANTSMIGQAIYDSTSTSAGFTLEGEECGAFTMSGNSACPIHVIMRWSTSGCSPAPCDAPITIQADIQYRAGGFFSMNDALYTLSFDQKLVGGSQACVGAPPASEAATCAARPYLHDQLICTSTGWRCGTVYF